MEVRRFDVELRYPLFFTIKAEINVPNFGTRKRRKVRGQRRDRYHRGHPRIPGDRSLCAAPLRRPR